MPKEQKPMEFANAKVPSVLIVEDDEQALNLMHEVLASLGAEVHPVADPERAAVMINQERFDGIFLDLNMPRIDGFELTKRIRQSAWNALAPVVIVTGMDADETMRKAFSSGATFFLQKPVDRQKLTKLFNATKAAMVQSGRFQLGQRRPGT